MGPTAAPPVTVAVHWVGSGSSPSAAANRSLGEWAEARGVRLSLPRAAPPVARSLDLAAASFVEDQLQRARDAITSEDTSGADSALDQAEELLRAHPDLPQAAWLMAEVLRARASRWRQLAPHDLKRSAEAWRRAAGLDGGRAPGVGEAAADPAVRREREPEREARTSLAFVGLPADEAERARVTMDGLPATKTLVGGAGAHQVRVTLDGALLWAGWVDLAVSQPGAEVTVTFARGAPCSREDLSRAAPRGSASTSSGVACGDWARVEELAPETGDLRISRCSGDVCGPPLRWSVGPTGPVVPDWREKGTRWPGWATVGLVTAGVVVVAGVTLAATSAFRPTRDQPVFTTGGLHVTSSPLVVHFGE